jgi:peptidoglycan-associated lipoprotein
MACQASVVIVSMLAAMLLGGCAAQSATNDANAAYTSAAMASAPMDRASDLARPRPGDYVTNGDLNDIHFEFDSYEIRPAAAKTLHASMEWMKSHPDSMLLIEGHADERGTSEYNLTLGERRARASMSYMVAHGIAARRISVVSFGEERALCGEHTESCWSKNRRAHFLVKLR